MKPKLLVATAALAMSIAACAQSNAQPNQIVGVASVIDGDTLEIHGERIRLSGIDAPERGQRCAGGVNVYQSASLALSNAIEGHTVRCEVSEEDRYGRHVAQCSVAGSDLALHMVEAGWARDWRRYSHGRYAAAERQARSASRGVWGMSCPGLWGDRSYD